jgi:hypothetical protein
VVGEAVGVDFSTYSNTVAGSSIVFGSATSLFCYISCCIDAYAITSSTIAFSGVSYDGGAALVCVSSTAASLTVRAFSLTSVSGTLCKSPSGIYPKATCFFLYCGSGNTPFVVCVVMVAWGFILNMEIHAGWRHDVVGRGGGAAPARAPFVHVPPPAAADRDVLGDADGAAELLARGA